MKWGNQNLRQKFLSISRKKPALCLQSSHIGDRLSNDIIGANEFGSKGIFCGVIHQRNMEDADTSFTSYTELKELLQANNLLN